MINRTFIGIVLFLFCLLCAPAAATASSAAMHPEQLKKILRENPQILFDILKEHSDELLGIVQDGANKRRNKELHKKWRKELTQNKHFNLKGHIARGPADAPVTIIAYSDFTCSFCAKAHEELTRLMAKYPNKIRYIFKTFSHGDDSIETLSAACFLAAAKQDKSKAWALHDIMFAKRQDIIDRGESALKALAAQVGLNPEQLIADSKQTSGTDILDDNLAEAMRLFVDGTPTVFINNLTLRGAPTSEQLEDAFKMALDAVNTK